MIDTEAATHLQRRCGTRAMRGVTLIEMLLGMVAVSILAAIANVWYGGYVDRARNAQAASDIRGIEARITKFYVENSRYPDGLTEAFSGPMPDCASIKANKSSHPLCDPWGNAYAYIRLVLDGYGNCLGPCRKDGNMKPLNSDFDLWSNGKDKNSVLQVSQPASLDDTIRTRNGRQIKLGKDL